jgi:hypothetical protein
MEFCTDPHKTKKCVAPASTTATARATDAFLFSRHGVHADFSGYWTGDIQEKCLNWNTAWLNESH